MKNVFIILIALFPFIIRGQITENSIIAKWKKAVVNLEFRSTNELQDKFRSMLLDQVVNRTISDMDYNRKLDSLMDHETVAFGTAIYFIHNNRRFFITARHVLIDDSGLDTNKRYDRIYLVGNGTSIPKKRPLTTSMFGGYIFLSFLSTSVADDLAIVDLDANPASRYINDALDSIGYKPITLEDIDTSCSIKKGQIIYAVGFPQISFQQPREIYQRYFESPNVSLPLFSKGTVEDTGKANFFYGNIFFYHGNSGGPVVLNNKLVGITSHLSIEKHTPNSEELSQYIILKMAFVKSSLIMPLLKKLDVRYDLLKKDHPQIFKR